jgi:putative heme-binding domain-containing protein
VEPTRSATAPGQAALAIHGTAPGHSWRILADLLARHPQPWGAPLLLRLIAGTPEADTELAYALKLAVKAHALTADAATLLAWSAAGVATADRVAEICLAVPTPAAAEFLLGYLTRTKLGGPRAGELAKHAALQLPPERFGEMEPLLASLTRVPPSQKLALAEGLATVAAKPGRTLPAAVEAWMRQELIAVLTDGDAAKSLKAINALKPLALPEAVAPLQKIARDSRAREANRSAALRALPAAQATTEEITLGVLASNAPVGLRRAAGELLGTATPSAAARAALAAAFVGAPADLALTLATALAKSDDGATDLLALATSGRVRPALLKHRYVATALEQRPAELRARITALTLSLPPEDARLDAVIAARLGAAGNYKPDAARGAPLFATHCAACHRFRDTGGNLGPSLDGIGSRALPRLVEDILDPSRNVDPTFRLTTVTLKSGETRSGMNFREEGDRIVMRDPASTEDVTIARADVASTAASGVSPMPATFETTLSEKEFFDLLEFLRAPGK